MGETATERLTRKMGWALAFALLYPVTMTWVYFVALGGGSATGGESVSLAVPYGIGKAIQFGFPAFWICVVERQRLRWSRPGPRGMLTGLGFGVLVAAAILALYHGVLADTDIFSKTAVEVRRKVEGFRLGGFSAATPGGYLVLALFLSLFHSLAEEYYWRWFVFGQLRRFLPLSLAIAVSSFGFMAHHVVVLSVYFPGQFLIAVVPFSLGVAVGGAVWAWVYHRTGSLAATWLSHILVDAAIMMVGYDLLFGRG
jgi:membrane protease YdiL (CAAX protease family)